MEWWIQEVNRHRWEIADDIWTAVEEWEVDRESEGGKVKGEKASKVGERNILVGQGAEANPEQNKRRSQKIAQLITVQHLTARKKP